jgi:hypothetical protein
MVDGILAIEADAICSVAHGMMPADDGEDHPPN